MNKEANGCAPVEWDVRQWNWMMDLCLSRRMPPAQQWAWNIAREEYDKAHNAKLRRSADEI